MIEYILRVWTADYLYPDEKIKWKARTRFIISAYGLIDLFSIIPYFLPFIFPAGAVAFRIFRVIRIFRLFRINAQYDAFNVITNVLKEKKNQLISSVCMIFILMLASSLCMYSLEHEAQPDQFKNAFSGLWWAVATLTTVGYGDIYPITPIGRFLGAIIAILGIGMVAVPTSILSAGFMELIETNAEEGANAPAPSKDHDHAPDNNIAVQDPVDPPQYCPHCGKKLFP